MSKTKQDDIVKLATRVRNATLKAVTGLAKVEVHIGRNPVTSPPIPYTLILDVVNDAANIYAVLNGQWEKVFKFNPNSIDDKSLTFTLSEVINKMVSEDVYKINKKWLLQEGVKIIDEIFHGSNIRFFIDLIDDGIRVNITKPQAYTVRITVRNELEGLFDYRVKNRIVPAISARVFKDFFNLLYYTPPDEWDSVQSTLMMEMDTIFRVR